MSLAVLADHMASKGRGGDSMLIHMAPSEIRGLQALAVANGSSLTINPDTGLPEALSLKKLLPAIIGFGITAMTGIPAWQVGLGVGAVETARTGDLGKGISAGLGAYGGAGLGASFTAAPVAEMAGSQIASQAVEQAALEGIQLPSNYAEMAAKTATPDQLMAARDSMSFGDLASKGATNFTNDPSKFATKDNFKYMAAAAAPVLADQAVKSNLPVTATKPGSIRPYSYDPYGGTYTAGTPYEAMPTKAADGGLMGLAAGGIAGYGDGDDVPRRVDNGMAQGGMYDFAQRSEPVVRMAKGGVPGYALGGTLAADLEKAYVAAQQSGDYSKVNDFVQANRVSEADIQNQWKGLDTSGLAGLGVNLVTPYANYTDEQIGSYFAANPNADIAADIKKFNADPAAVNRYIANIPAPFVGSTETTGGSGTLGVYNNLIAQGIDPNELYASRIANDPNYAGWTKNMLNTGYNLAGGALDLVAKDKDSVTDKEWVNFMDTNGYSINDMAQSFGLSLKEVRDRYNAVKNAEKKVVTPIVPTTVIPGVNDYGLGGTGTSGRLENVLGSALPPGVSGAGITTVNPNGTITTRPNIPGIPEGGFTGMTDLRNAYTKGGGSLGYIPYTPKTIDEFNAKYKTTGGSKAALDYLMGKTPYSPVPVTPTGEIQKPYWESVGRFPENRKAKKYVYVDGKYQLNPDYVKPSYVLAGEKAAADKAAEEKTTKAGVDSGKSINVLDNQGNTEPAYMRDDGFYYTSGGNKFDEKGVQVAAGGGLAALTMANGGMSGQFDLGGYSDGGRLLRGPGDGVSDSIPATIGNKRPARLADGEFVVPARIVSELGNGSTEAGARKLYAMMDRVQKARRGTVGKGKVAKNSRSDKYLPA